MKGGGGGCRGLLGDMGDAGVLGCDGGRMGVKGRMGGLGDGGRLGTTGCGGLGGRSRPGPGMYCMGQHWNGSLSNSATWHVSGRPGCGKQKVVRSEQGAARSRQKLCSLAVSGVRPMLRILRLRRSPLNRLLQLSETTLPL